MQFKSGFRNEIVVKMWTRVIFDGIHLEIVSYLEMDGSELDKIVLEYMKSKKHHRSSTLFESYLKSQPKHSPKKTFSDLDKLIRQFNAYLLESEIRKSNESDDLGFEINFDAITTPGKV